jgi:hypothetical protein
MGKNHFDKISCNIIRNADLFGMPWIMKQNVVIEKDIN